MRINKQFFGLTLLFLAGLMLSAGCSKKEEDSKSKCKRGELELSVKMAGELKAAGVPSAHDCPSRLSTTGARPPSDSWVGGAEPFWGPELVVLIDKKRTVASRKAALEDSSLEAKAREEAASLCVYAWSQGCSDTAPQE